MLSEEFKTTIGFIYWVLILIVLEDALWGLLQAINDMNNNGLNPYCIGRCSLRSYHPMSERLERSLNPYCIGRCSLRSFAWNQAVPNLIVLILIVLEDALWEIHRRPMGEVVMVLILIVLEDALWVQGVYRRNKVVSTVLILIVLEDALWANKPVLCYQVHRS